MPPRLAPLLFAAALPLQTLAQPLGLVECRGLRERRNQLAAEAMQAEIALVLATRRRLCPQQEALAEQAHAGGETGRGEGDDQTSPAVRADLDYSAYLQCRNRAEQLLRRSRVILYTNLRGFTFYTLAGARLAREADAWQLRLREGCGAAGGS